MNNYLNNTSRIKEIDFLRAFVLLGIFIVHLIGNFSIIPFSNDSKSLIDQGLVFINNFFLTERLSAIFSILFGISFHIILIKTNYNRKKLIFRCLLLSIIGLLNKIFYTYDILFWYGLSGILLAQLTYLKKEFLIFLIVFILALKVIFYEFLLGDYIFDDILDYRQNKSTSFITLLKTVPIAVKLYLKMIFNYNPLITVCNFLIGYCIALFGFIFLKKNIYSIKTLILISILYGFILYYPYTLPNLTIIKIFFVIAKPLGALYYMYLFFYLYSNSIVFQNISKYFESYGRLGLTNYSIQGVIGCFLFYDFGLGLSLLPYQKIILAVLIFFLQTVLSKIWLKHFNYGPIEYIWRYFTKLPFKNKYQ